MGPVRAPSLPDEVRAACARVAEEARHVRIDEAEVRRCAETLPHGRGTEPGLLAGAEREEAAALVICLDAINFGSGWWPTIRRAAGKSGYGTIAAGVESRFRESGPWSAVELEAMDAATIAAAAGQRPDHPLMEQFAAALRDVGGQVAGRHRASFAAVADAAADAPALAGLLAGWEAFGDASTYRGRRVPFYKRAQIAVADLQRAGVVRLADLGLLTAFADNLLPHVLRVDGVLRLDPDLRGLIESGRLLEHGSEPEVELRACAVQAVELLAAATGLPPPEVDSLLWNRGRHPRYKARPRPRSRNTAY